MKFALLLVLMCVAGCLSGCNAAPEKANEVNPTTTRQDSEPVPEKAPEKAVNTSLPAANEWRFLFSDLKKDEIVALFEKARQIVEEKKGLHGTVSQWSMYFGPWLIVEIEQKSKDPDMFATDERAPRNRAFLVDMASETLIETGDWRAAKPFFELLVDVYREGGEASRAKEKFLNFMASAASTVGLGHTAYVESGSGSVVPGPKFSRGMNRSELVYYVDESAMAVSYTKCTLTITGANIIFNSEIAEP